MVRRAVRHNVSHNVYFGSGFFLAVCSPAPRAGLSKIYKKGSIAAAQFPCQFICADSGRRRRKQKKARSPRGGLNHYQNHTLAHPRLGWFLRRSKMGKGGGRSALVTASAGVSTAVRRGGVARGAACLNVPHRALAALLRA